MRGCLSLDSDDGPWHIDYAFLRGKEWKSQQMLSHDKSSYLRYSQHFQQPTETGATDWQGDHGCRDTVLILERMCSDSGVHIKPPCHSPLLQPLSQPTESHTCHKHRCVMGRRWGLKNKQDQLHQVTKGLLVSGLASSWVHYR